MKEIYLTKNVKDCKTFMNLKRSNLIIKILFFIKNK